MLKTCGELGIGFVPWGPVGMGFLTGKIDARTRLRSEDGPSIRFRRFALENPGRQSAGRRSAEPVAGVASTPRLPARACLATSAAAVDRSIPGTRNIDHLGENLSTISVQLTPADLREMKAALSKISVHGGRMNKDQMEYVDSAT